MLSALVLAAAAGSARAAAKATCYLSLGDSLAQGYQPIGGPRTFNVSPIYDYDWDYADQLFRLEGNTYTQLRIVKLGCGGESCAGSFRAAGLVLPLHLSADEPGPRGTRVEPVESPPR